MGGSSKQTAVKSETQQTTPYAPAADVLTGVLGGLRGVNANLNPNETGAINKLSQMGAAGNKFAPAIGNVANTLLAGGGADRTGMVNDAYSQYQRQISPYANGEYNDPTTNPVLQKYLQVARDDASNSIKSQYAAAGRLDSGMADQNVSRGIMQAEAPILMDAYNQSLGRQITAAGSLFGAGGQTAGLLSGLDQTRLGNMTAGVGTADSANAALQYGPLMQLQAEAQRAGIPLERYAKMMGIALPAGQAFATTTGYGTTDQTTSVPISQQIIGGAVGGLGLLGGLGYKPFGKPA
jgi:hypothetical protein